MLAKYIYSQVVKLSLSKGFVSRLLLIFFQEFRTQYLKYSNPSFGFDIKSVINKNGSHDSILAPRVQTKLNIPLSYTLPIILTRQPFYSLNYPRIAKVLSSEIADFKLIDIGANIGDGVFLCRLFGDYPILCLEGDSQYFELLKSNIAPHGRVDSYFSFIGKEDKSVVGNVEKKEGTVALVENSGGKDKIEFKKLSTILNQKTSFQDFKMIKIDTDGFDVDIIKSFGEEELANHPVIFFEYDPYYVKRIGTDPFSVFDFLISKGYTDFLFYDNFGYLITTVKSTEISLMENLNQYYDNRDGKHYFDICAFHSADSALFNKVEFSEKQFFKHSKKQ